MTDHDKRIEEPQLLSLEELETASGGGLLDPFAQMLQSIPVVGQLAGGAFQFLDNLLPI